MKTIEVEETVNSSYRVYDWSMGCVGVNTRHIYMTLSHERDIPEDWPRKVKRACLNEILPNRELAEDEVRTGDVIWQLRWHEGIEECRIVPLGYWVAVDQGGRVYGPSRKWFATNRPLGDNETVSVTGKRGTMSVDGEWLRISWEDGQKSKHTRLSMVGILGGDWGRRRAYYDKHKPAPLADDGSEFIDFEGDRWTFKMRDDGEVDCLCSTGAISNTSRPCGSDWARAALAYRDKERARWGFVFEKCGDVAVTEPDGTHCGFWLAGRNEASFALTYAPTWVQEKARALWEEQQKPKRVEFEARVVEVRGPSSEDGKVSLSCGYGDATNATGLVSKLVRVTIEEVE